jgi:hypothetical protein
MSLPNPEALYARLRDQIEKAFPDRSELGPSACMQIWVLPCHVDYLTAHFIATIFLSAA